HQLLSISHGYKTYKLKIGHHGGNHPLKNSLTKKVQSCGRVSSEGSPGFAAPAFETAKSPGLSSRFVLCG
ncbi:MAG TPA: hypothetical protein EYP49_14690, partial [Anaerolineae bacterium]|nr:hypothetical protein [Anaerolineae bacterium]